MIALFIDTATPQGSLALYRNGELLDSIRFGEQMNHLKTLHPSIKKMLERSGLSIKETGLYGVDTGPGSFTGIRIGVSAARTLCQLGGTRIFSAVSLDILCCKARSFGGLLVPVLDAKKNSLYTAVYSWEKKGLKRRSPYYDIRPEKLLEMLEERPDDGRTVLFLGDGQKEHHEILKRLKRKKEFTDSSFFYPEAKDIFFLMKGKRPSRNYESIRPFYLRRSDAEALKKP